MISFVEVLRRAHEGPYCTLRDWNVKVISENTRKLVKEHGLEGTYDSENLVNTDDGLADEFWEAGYELALEAGMYCINTERIVKYSEEELKEAEGFCMEFIDSMAQQVKLTAATLKPEKNRQKSEGASAKKSKRQLNDVNWKGLGNGSTGKKS